MKLDNKNSDIRYDIIPSNLDGLVIPTIKFSDGTSMLVKGIFGSSSSRWENLLDEPVDIDPASFGEYQRFFDATLEEMIHNSPKVIHRARGQLFKVYNSFKALVNASRAEFLSQLRKRFPNTSYEEFIELGYFDEWLISLEECVDKTIKDYPDFDIELNEDIQISKDFGVFTITLSTMDTFSEPSIYVTFSYEATMLLKTIFASKNIIRQENIII